MPIYNFELSFNLSSLAKPSQVALESSMDALSNGPRVSDSNTTSGTREFKDAMEKFSTSGKSFQLVKDLNFDIFKGL